MKTVKSLLLAGAAAVAASSAVQAADLPAAEPVEYVRVCDAYGAGFFFIPGTDTCLRISGLVRVQAFYHSDNATATNWDGASRTLLSPTFRSVAGLGLPTHGATWLGAPITFAAAVNNRIAGTTTTVNGVNFVGPGWAKFSDPYRDQLDMGVRALLRFDARSRTEWGVLRSFFEFNANSATNAINGTGLEIRYGFVQFGPITAGLTDSFFNFDGGTYYGDVPGDRATRVITWAYTATFGNGISATVALEDATAPQGAGIAGIGGGTGGLLFTAGAAQRSSQLPDLVGNLRVAQSWGTAQLSGVIGQRRYLDSLCVFPGSVGTSTCSWNDTIWAIKGGLRVNLPMIGAGSHINVQAAYGQGATNFVAPGALSTQNHWQSTFVPGGAAIIDERALNRVDSWSVFANLVAFFTPAVRGSLYGGYGDLRYRGNAGQLPGNGAVLPDYTWTVGGNLQWTPVRALDIGVDVFYTNTRYIAVNGAPGLGPLGVISRTSDNGWGTIFRVQRSF
jgi:hypothetical protein